MSITMYHNPRCSKSRATLELLHERGLAPEIVLYLDAPPDPATLGALARKLQRRPRDFLRTGESAWKDLGLSLDSVDDDQLLRLMSEHPILIERPIVVCGKRARIGRPPEAVLEILPGS